MAPNFEFQEWWNKEKEIHRGTSVVVKMENPNWSMVELQSPDDDFRRPDKQGRGKNARQLTWVLLLKAHRAAGCVAWLAQGLWSLLSAVKRRVTVNKNQNRVTDENRPGKSKLYKVIRGFLLFAILMLGFEIGAYMKGWHFTRPHFDFTQSLDLQGALHSVYSEWIFIRATYLAPPLQALANFCIVLFLIQSADRLVLAMGCLWIHIKKIKPVPQFEYPGSAADLEKGAFADYPMVLVQIPMCNEMEVNLCLSPWIAMWVLLVSSTHIIVQCVFLFCNIEERLYNIRFVLCIQNSRFLLHSVFFCALWTEVSIDIGDVMY